MVFEEAFIQLGRKFSKRGWKAALASNEGIFKRAKRSPKYVIGPRLDKSGRVVGDMMTMELQYFMQITTREQQLFFNRLQRVRPLEAQEYVLTISGAIDVWKEDIKWLQVALRYLEKEEKALKIKEKLEKEIKGLPAKLPPILKRHFPQLFNKVDLDNLDLKRSIEKIRQVEEWISAEENYLREYLEKTRHQLPFLFK